MRAKIKLAFYTILRLALFDTNPDLIGGDIYGIPVYSVDALADFCRENNVHIGVLTVPKEAAYDVAVTMAEAGVEGIWNFANMELKLPDHRDVIVENIHLGDSLMTLCYEIKTKNDEKESDSDNE